MGVRDAVVEKVRMEKRDWRGGCEGVGVMVECCDGGCGLGDGGA